jgi:cold shock CspA family protein
LSATPARLSGRVVNFSASVGLGTVAVDDGRSWDFHCTAIAGGSRDVAVGAAVTFVVGAARAGRWEAQDVSPDERQPSDPEHSS